MYKVKADGDNYIVYRVQQALADTDGTLVDTLNVCEITSKEALLSKIEGLEAQIQDANEILALINALEL